ncbi:MAG: quorum-sensing autoinducer synthase [Proteobacteria bacterium]|nr:quorum-sensing autoinducer synthase [Pseudomonadota bacterium]
MLNTKNTWLKLTSRTNNNTPDFLNKRVDAYEKRSVNPISGGHFIKGRVPKIKDIQLVSNDYLSISGNQAIKDSQTRCIQEKGHGILRSGVFQIGDTLQKQFENKVASWLSADDALLSQSGWAANCGLIQSIASADVPVYVDMMAHMSLWEGIKSAGATARPFRHNSVDSLEKLIKKYGQGIILVDAIYSTSGSVCPLEEIAELSQRHECILVVDESHSFGVIGDRGEGMVSKLGLEKKVQFRTASLSKAFAGRGGIIVGSSRNIDYIRYESFPAIFSSGVLDYDIAGFITALEIIQKENHRRVKLVKNADYLRAHLQQLGYNVDESQTQIISLVPGPEHRTIILRDNLEKRGVFGAPFCAPATPKNRSLIRFTVNADMTTNQLHKVVTVCKDIREIVCMNEWQSTTRKVNLHPKMACQISDLSMAI